MGLDDQKSSEEAVDPGLWGSQATTCYNRVPELSAVEFDTPAEILFLETEAAEREATQKVLASQGHHVVTAQDWQQALSLLESRPALELIISDLESVDPQGLSLAHYLSEPHLLNNLPVIILSRGQDLTPLFGHLSAGSVDFLQRPFSSEELLMRTQKALIQSRTMRLYLSAAHRDHLTGLYNKRVFSEMLKREMSRAQRYGVPLGLLFADLDHFKQVNDTYGHQAGDQVLQAFALRVCQWVREGDLVARYGGEEFTMLGPGAGRQGISILGERIRQAMERPIDTDSGELVVTISMGAAVFEPAKDDSPEDFLKRADQALYQAKEGGRNRMVLAD